MQFSEREAAMAPPDPFVPVELQLENMSEERVREEARLDNSNTEPFPEERRIEEKFTELSVIMVAVREMRGVDVRVIVEMRVELIDREEEAQ